MMGSEVADKEVKQDLDGRYCLNNLHKAAGGEARHKPSNWLQQRSTQELVDEVSIAGIPAIYKKQGLGTFVVKELVYAYAMWISPAFSLKVIRAYDTLQTQGVAVADLTGKAVGHVHRDILSMLESLYEVNPNLDRIDFEGISVQRRIDGQVSEFLLDRYHTEVLVTGYEVQI